MLSRYLTAAAVALQGVYAFQDASPFFMFSTDVIDTHTLPDAQVASAESIKKGLQDAFSGCPSKPYVFVSQPGVSVENYADAQSAPHLRRWLSGEDETIKSAVRISNVGGGGLDATDVRSWLAWQCSEQSKRWTLLNFDLSHGEIPPIHSDNVPDVFAISFTTPSAGNEKRASALARHDSNLNNFLSTLPAYTVFYMTSPPSGAQPLELQHPDAYYEMDDPYPSGMHTDLKRDLTSSASSGNTSDNLAYNVPLFEKYQFFSTGIFVGGTVTILLLSILYVGVSAIANLEVSYMAFSKEMGPAAQKKQQPQ